MHDMEIHIGRKINFAEFFSLRAIALDLLKKREIIEPQKSVCTLSEIFSSKGKGSRKYRNFVLKPRYDKGNLKRLDFFPDIPRNDLQLISYNSFWFSAQIDNKSKLIFYKFLSNTLITNFYASKFDVNVDPRCSYCKKIPYFPAYREDPFHLFVNCPTIATWREALCKIYASLPDTELLPSTIFLGSQPSTNDIMLFNNTISLIFINYVFSNRARRGIASKPDMITEIRSRVDFYAKTWSRLRKSLFLVRRRFPENDFFKSIELYD